MYFRDVRKRREKLKNLEKSNIHSRFRRIRSGHDQGLGRGMKNTDQGISSRFHVLTIRFEVTVRSVRWESNDHMLYLSPWQQKLEKRQLHEYSCLVLYQILVYLG